MTKSLIFNVSESLSIFYIRIFENQKSFFKKGTN